MPRIAAGRACSTIWRRPAPSSVEDLCTELRLRRQELNALRAPLQRCGAILPRSPLMTGDDEHSQAGELMRWDQAYPSARLSAHDQGDRDPATALADLTAAAVSAAVVAPEAELRRWFSWPWYWSGSLVDDLVTRRRLRRVDGHVTAWDGGAAIAS